MKKFTQHPHGSNELLQLDENSYISFNANPLGGSSFLGSDDNQPETALVLDGKFYILNGDFRSHYEKAFEKGGIEACVAVFNSFPNHVSSWTTASSIENWLKERVKNISKNL